jgi:hypothetical protein
MLTWAVFNSMIGQIYWVDGCSSRLISYSFVRLFSSCHRVCNSEETNFLVMANHIDGTLYSSFMARAKASLCPVPVPVGALALGVYYTDDTRALFSGSQLQVKNEPEKCMLRPEGYHSFISLVPIHSLEDDNWDIRTYQLDYL